MQRDQCIQAAGIHRLDISQVEHHDAAVFLPNHRRSKRVNLPPTDNSPRASHDRYIASSFNIDAKHDRRPFNLYYENRRPKVPAVIKKM
jgi:hypothetical protein